MFILILVSYFIGFQLSNNLVPSSYMIEFAIGKRVLWGMDWGYFYRKYKDSRTENKASYYYGITESADHHLNLSFPVRLLLREIAFLNKLETDFLIKFSPNYDLVLSKLKTITSDSIEIENKQKQWIAGINIGFSFDFSLKYKGIPFKIRLNTNFMNLSYREEILEYQKEYNSEYFFGRSVKKYINIYIENILKNNLGIYLIFKL